MQLGLSSIPEKTRRKIMVCRHIRWQPYCGQKQKYPHPHQSNCRLTGDLCVRKNPSQHQLSLQAPPPHAHRAGFMRRQSQQTQRHNRSVGDADLNQPAAARHQPRTHTPQPHHHRRIRRIHREHPNPRNFASRLRLRFIDWQKL